MISLETANARALGTHGQELPELDRRDATGTVQIGAREMLRQPRHARLLIEWA